VHQRQAFFGKILTFGREVDSTPEPRRVGGDLAVEILQEPVQYGRAKCAWVSIQGSGIWKQGALQVESSTVVSFTETSGQYEDFSLIAHGGSAHGPRIVMLGGCVNKAIGLFVTETHESGGDDRRAE